MPKKNLQDGKPKLSNAFFIGIESHEILAGHGV